MNATMIEMETKITALVLALALIIGFSLSALATGCVCCDCPEGSCFGDAPDCDAARAAAGCSIDLFAAYRAVLTDSGIARIGSTDVFRPPSG